MALDTSDTLAQAVYYSFNINTDVVGVLGHVGLQARRQIMPELLRFVKALPRG